MPEFIPVQLRIKFESSTKQTGNCNFTQYPQNVWVPGIRDPTRVPSVYVDDISLTNTSTYLWFTAQFSDKNPNKYINTQTQNISKSKAMTDASVMHEIILILYPGNEVLFTFKQRKRFCHKIRFHGRGIGRNSCLKLCYA